MRSSKQLVAIAVDQLWSKDVFTSETSQVMRLVTCGLRSREPRPAHRDPLAVEAVV